MVFFTVANFAICEFNRMIWIGFSGTIALMGFFCLRYGFDSQRENNIRTTWKLCWKCMIFGTIRISRSFLSCCVKGEKSAGNSNCYNNCASPNFFQKRDRDITLLRLLHFSCFQDFSLLKRFYETLEFYVWYLSILKKLLLLWTICN